MFQRMMRRAGSVGALFAVLVMALSTTPALAQTPVNIGQFPLAGTLTGSEFVPMEQAGHGTVRAQLSAISAYVLTGFTGDANTWSALQTFGANVDLTGTVAGGKRSIFYQTSGVNRFSEGLDATAETGSPTGSNFQICRFTDTATVIDCPILIPRSTGVVSFIDGISVPAGSITGAELASGAVSASLGYVPVNKAGDTMTGALSAPSFILGGAPETLTLGNQTGSVGGNQIQDWLWSDGVTNPKTIGAIWPGTVTYAAETFSSTFTNSHPIGQLLNGGPIFQHLDLAYQGGANNAIVASGSVCVVKTVGGGYCSAGNDVAAGPSGSHSVQLVGREIDVAFSAGNTDAGGSIGLPINVFNVNSISPAILLGSISGSWGNGIGFGGGSVSTTGADLYTAPGTAAQSFINTTNTAAFGSYFAILHNGAGNGISWGGVGGTNPNLYADTSNNMIVQVGAPGVFTVKDKTGVNNLDYVLQTSPTTGDHYISGNLYLGGVKLSPPIQPAAPDTIEGYFNVTSTASNPTVTVAGASFVSGDVGKLIGIEGVGPTEGWLMTSISAVNSGTSITLANAPTQSASSQSLRLFYGSDQTTNLQTAFNAGVSAGTGSFTPAGVYLVASPLTCPGNSSGNNNAFTQPYVLCDGSPAATIVAMAPMTSLLTYGSLSGTYSGYLQFTTVRGFTLDCHFEASYCADFPFFNNITRQGQTAKNALLGYVRYGNVGAPAASAGAVDQNDFFWRDISYVAVSSVTNGVNPTVTTARPHGYATGRVVTFIGSNLAPLNATPFQITVTGPSTFTLNNTDSTSWGSFSSGNVALNEPGTPFPFTITGITNANPGVVTVSGAHGFTNGSSVCLYNVGTTLVDGCYTIGGVSSNTFQLTGVNTTSLGSFTGGGIALAAPTPTAVAKLIYYENAGDGEVLGDEGAGAVYGVYSNPATSGYDGKFQFHWYNLPEHGLMFAAFSGGGDNTILGAQIDCPALFGFRFTGTHNRMDGAGMDCAGFSVLQNNLASYVRLESGASVQINGGSAKGASGQSVLQTVSALGSLGAFGTVSGFQQFGFDTSFVTFTQPALNVTGNAFVSSDTVIGGSLSAAQVITTGATPSFAGTCAVTGAVGGVAGGSFTASGACVAGTVIIPQFTAPHGHACFMNDETTPANLMKQIAHSGTSATFQGSMTNGDTMVWGCPLAF